MNRFLIMKQSCFLPVLAALSLTQVLAAAPPEPAEAKLFPLSAVRLTGHGPFTAAVEANRSYLLAHDPDRLLAPFLREAGLKTEKPPYDNWESMGLDGHTAGHYLSALAMMVASGADTPDGKLAKRLDHMLDELERVQKKNGDGYLGGVPGSKQLWKDIAAGKINAHGFGLNDKWVPWYNLHKTFAGLRDAYLMAGREKAKTLLVDYGEWVEDLVSGLSDAQLQDMLRSEHGGMNEVLADIHAITGNDKFLALAKRFNHHAILDPLVAERDELTGKHANTQIPKVIGLQRIAALSGDEAAHGGAEFFWQTVTRDRSVAFGGNSVSEHFNDVHDFRRVLEHREGPESCNTYNMLRLTEQLFEDEPKPEYADYYERALFNHILSVIHPHDPGYVYFTPLRPAHYRVYSEPEKAFWCCVGSGMENPGKYGQFVYARAQDGVFVNLFIASELKTSAQGLTLRQETGFPYEESSRLTVDLPEPKKFTIHLRHPRWAGGGFAVKVNGEAVDGESEPGTYLSVRREWKSGDTIELTLPMKTRAEPLPDGSDWHAILHGPIVMAAPCGTKDLVGLRAGTGRGDHIAGGPLVPLDQVPSLVTTADQLPQYVKADPDGEPLHFRIVDVVSPPVEGGQPLVPFFSLHDQRYQMYWSLVPEDELEKRQQELAAEEKARKALEERTLDWVAVGEQQPEVEHGFKATESSTGEHRGRRWRDGKSFQYTLKTQGAGEAELAITYWGGDRDRAFDIFANEERIAQVSLDAERPGEFITRRYPIPSAVLAKAKDGGLKVRFEATKWVAGGIFEVRLMRPED